MPIPSYYNTGTATLTNGSTAVTGSGTAWSDAGIRAGDVIRALDGRSAVIADVGSNTSLTLLRAWPGTSQTSQAYEITRALDSVRVQETTIALLAALSGGNLSALQGLTSVADRLPYFTGSGTMAMVTFAAAIRSLIQLTAAANKLPYYDSATTAALTDLTAGGRAILGLTYAADRIPYTTSASAAAVTPLTAGARAILGLTYAADRIPYTTSDSAAALATLTSFARSLLDDTDAATARATLAIPAEFEARGLGQGTNLQAAPGDNANNIVNNGKWWVSSSGSNAPTAHNYIIDHARGSTANQAVQLALGQSVNGAYYRRMHVGTWNSWVRLD